MRRFFLRLLIPLGGPIEGLMADDTTYYTQTFKVNVDGQAGKNNSIGVGSLIRNLNAEDSCVRRFVNFYGNYNSEFPEGADAPNRVGQSLTTFKPNGYSEEMENARG